MDTVYALRLSFQAGLSTTLVQAFWYVLFASITWLVFYVLFRRRYVQRKICRSPLKSWQVAREIRNSLRSIGIFGIIASAIVYAALNGWTKFYPHVKEFGWTWFFFSIALMIVMHDTYFYWTHRAMHHPKLFRLFHRTHHLSTTPTPWAAYAFSPLEAIVQSGISILIAFTLPVHPIAFSIFMLWQIAFNVLGHCGYEIFPQWFLGTRVGSLLNSPTHHALHHEKARANFSLYFNVWDRWMGTNDSEYLARFQQVTAPKHLE